MTEHVQVGGLQVAKVLFDFVNNEAIPGTGLTADAFWAGADKVIHDLAPKNKALLAKRDDFQAQIDAWHQACADQAHDAVAYKAFLQDIGYLLPEAADFQATTQNVDDEIARMAGPQLGFHAFGGAVSEDYKWAMDVLSRIDGMKEPAGFFYGSKIAWHPVLQLIFAVLHLRRTNPSDLEPARRLLWLTDHPHEEAADFAFTALLADPDAHVSWVAAQLALERACHYRPAIKEDGERDTRSAKKAAKAAFFYFLLFQKHLRVEKFIEEFPLSPQAYLHQPFQKVQ